MSVPTRLRFEILKRDGFRCAYCGATPLTALLHVDHVVPASEGGPDLPENLVTACATCNLGKSNVPLEEQRLKHLTSGDDLTARASQVHEYVQALKSFEEARVELRDHYAGLWRQCVGDDPPTLLYQRFDLDDAELGHARVVEAIGAVAMFAQGRWGWPDAEQQTRYYRGVLRRMRAVS